MATIVVANASRDDVTLIFEREEGKPNFTVYPATPQASPWLIQHWPPAPATLQVGERVTLDKGGVLKLIDKLLS
jgi:hypothetical protein